MSKLSKDDLLDEYTLTYKLVAWVDLFKYECSHSDQVNWDEKDEQAYKQIKEMIQTSINLRNKSLGKLAEGLGVSFSAAKIISDHAQPQVTEELIDEKARELLIKANILINTPEAHQQQLKIIKHFIRKLYEEMPANKVTVSEDWIYKKMGELFAKHTIGFPTPKAIEIFTEMLTELGLEVVKK